LTLALQSVSPANALSEHQVLIFLVQVALLIAVARTLGAGMKKLGQPPVVGELLAGVVLGPSILGTYLPDLHRWIFVDEPVATSLVGGLAWMGVILLLVVIGFETDLAIIARFRRAALAVATGSLLIPLAAVALFALAMPDEFRGVAVDHRVFAAFVGLAMSVSALPVVAKILQDLGYLRRDFGQIILAAGLAKDGVAWLLLGAIAGLAQGGFRPTEVVRSLGGLAVFLVLAVTVGRRVVDWLFRAAMIFGSSVTAAITVTVVAALVGGIATQALGLEAILGAFVIGIVLAATRHQLPQVRDVMESITAAIFAPIFFASAGLRVDVTALGSPELVWWAVGAVALAIVAKILGTVLFARTAGIGGREGLALGAGLSALGAVGIVVAITGLNLGVVSTSGYSMMVAAAIVTSLGAPLLLRLVVRGMPLRGEEAARLEREALREESFLLSTSRVLLPSRGGRNSRHAARLVWAALDEPEVTLLAVDVERRWWRRGESAAGSDVLAELGLPKARLVRRTAADPAQAIAREARLGYGLLVLGASEEEGEGAFLSTVVDRVVAQIDIATAVVRLPATFAADRLPQRILVPVAATNSTRAAEEFAYSLARKANGSAVALHVVNRPDGQGILLEHAQIETATRVGHEMVATAAVFGSRLGVDVETVVRVAPNAEAEIVELANTGGFDLLVIGTSNRPLTSRPFFGHRVTYIVEKAEIPVVVVSLPSSR